MDYKFDDLSSLGIEDLRPIAQNLGIKKLSSEKETLIFQILDKQAEDAAANMSVKGKKQNKENNSNAVTKINDDSPKKRGRKKKPQDDIDVVESVQPDEKPVTEIGMKEEAFDNIEDPKPAGQNDKKKKGRPKAKGPKLQHQVPPVEEDKSKPETTDGNNVVKASSENDTQKEDKKPIFNKAISSGLTLVKKKKPEAEIKQEPVQTENIEKTAHSLEPVVSVET